MSNKIVRLDVLRAQQERPADVATVQIPIDYWPTIARGISKPWGDDAVKADLLWLAACERFDELARMPEADALAQRWGWEMPRVVWVLTWARVGGVLA